MPRKSQRACRVFYSYSHKDSSLRAKLAEHLSLLRRDGLVSEWFDGKIPAGGEIDRDIEKNLADADLVLLLISSNFLSSEYCWGIEMNRALERHARGAARVIPIILRPIEDGWTETVFGKLKALPADGRPVTKWANRDEAWANVTNGIRGAIIELGGGKSAVAAPKTQSERRRR